MNGPVLARHDYEALLSSLNSIIWEADAATFHFTYVSQQAVLRDLSAYT